MPIPVHLLIAAAKTLSDPNTIKTVKSIYDAGTGLIDKAQGLRSAPPKQLSPPTPAPKGPACRHGEALDAETRRCRRPDPLHLYRRSRPGERANRRQLDKQRARAERLLPEPAG